MDGRELLEAAQRLRPDLVITAISMPLVDGLEATRRLQTAVPGARVLILSVAPPTPPLVNGLLTPRELDTVRLLSRGLSNKLIARHLGVSVATVRTHLNKAYDKLGSASRVELALLAAQPGGAVM